MNKLIKSTLAAMVVAAIAAGGAMAQTSKPVDSAGNTVDPSGKHAGGSQINPVEERQNQMFGNDTNAPLPGVKNESNQVNPGTGTNNVHPNANTTTPHSTTGNNTVGNR